MLTAAVEVRICVDYVVAAAQAFEDVEIDVEITADRERPAAPVVPVEMPLVMKPPAEIRLYVLKRNVPHFSVNGFVAEDSALFFAFESEYAAELDLLRVAGRSVYYGRIDSPEVFDRFVVSPYGIDYIERDDLLEVLRALFERSCIFVHGFIAFVLSLWFITFFTACLPSGQFRIYAIAFSR